VLNRPLDERATVEGNKSNRLKLILSRTCGDTSGDRGTSSVVGTILLVAVVVVGGVTSAYVLDVRQEVAGPDIPSDAIEAEHGEHLDGEWVRFTLTAGDAVQADRLVVVATTEVDIHGDEDEVGYTDPDYKSRSESFTEGADQAGIGDAWTAGEDVYVGSDSDLSGETFRVVWNTEPVEGENPGEVVGEDSHVLFEFTV
jgi:flagellin-like protein